MREIASQGRDATGVRVMNLDGGDAVAAVAPVAGEVVGDGGPPTPRRPPTAWCSVVHRFAGL